MFILNLFIGILPTHRKRNLHLNCLSICVQKRSPVEAPPFVRYCCHNWADNDPYLSTINRPSRNNGSRVWKRRKRKKMSEGESGRDKCSLHSQWESRRRIFNGILLSRRRDGCELKEPMLPQRCQELGSRRLAKVGRSWRGNRRDKVLNENSICLRIKEDGKEMTLSFRWSLL